MEGLDAGTVELDEGVALGKHEGLLVARLLERQLLAALVPRYGRQRWLRRRERRHRRRCRRRRRRAWHRRARRHEDAAFRHHVRRQCVLFFRGQSISHF